MHRSLSFVMLICATLFVACNTGVDTEVWADDYDRSCEAPSDCVAITEGDLCSCAGDGVSAIAASDLAEFSEDADAARDACGDELEVCGSLTEERAHQEASPLARVALCEAGTCVGKFARDVEGSVEVKMDRTCSSDSDCTTVPAQFDEPCGCKVAVSNAGAEAALSVAESKGIDLGESCTCDSNQVGAKCVTGFCQLTEDTCETTGWYDTQCEPNP